MRRWWIAASALLAALIAVSALGLREHHRRSELELRAHHFCLRIRTGLETSISNRIPPERLRPQMQHHFLNEALAGFCLGDDIPVNDEHAVVCWINTQNEHCYDKLAMELLEVYRQRVSD